MELDELEKILKEKVKKDEEWDGLEIKSVNVVKIDSEPVEVYRRTEKVEEKDLSFDED